jgi:uncharacterized membrane protein HdeD (DUF308 family)
MSEVAMDAKQGMAAEDAAQWWVPLVMGIVSVVFGLLLLSHPAETSIWVAWLVGVYWFIGGVVNLVMMFVDRTQWGWKLALGVLGIFAGVVVLDAMGQAPLMATVGLAAVYIWILGIQGVAFGMVQIIQAFQGGGWSSGILGAVSVLFGFLLVANPLPATLALPVVFGVLAIAGGVATMVTAYRMKKA